MAARRPAGGVISARGRVVAGTGRADAGRTGRAGERTRPAAGSAVPRPRAIGIRHRTPRHRGDRSAHALKRGRLDAGRPACSRGSYALAADLSGPCGGYAAPHVGRIARIVGATLRTEPADCTHATTTRIGAGRARPVSVRGSPLPTRPERETPPSRTGNRQGGASRCTTKATGTRAERQVFRPAHGPSQLMELTARFSGEGRSRSAGTCSCSARGTAV
jgi:hypothetical protein